MLITPTQHEKNEWSRMATAAYGASVNSVGHSYSIAASLPNIGTISVAYFDQLQAGYRAWLVDGAFIGESR